MNTHTFPATPLHPLPDPLAQLGVCEDALLSGQREALDRDGFVMLPNVLDAAQVGRLRARIDQLVREEGAHAGHEVHQEEGTARLADLVNKGDEFHCLWTNPLVLSAVWQVLRRPFKLSSLNSRESLAGHGGQPLHSDGPNLEPDQAFTVVNSFWLLDDIDEGNGATRFLPGSHLGHHAADGRWMRTRRQPPEVLADPRADHPQQLLTRGSAGSVLVFNGHAWHSGTINRDGRRRRGVHAYYTARECGQQTNQRERLGQAVAQRLTPPALWLLDAQAT